jgi:hypothetical protein
VSSRGNQGLVPSSGTSERVVQPRIVDGYEVDQDVGSVLEVGGRLELGEGAGERSIALASPSEATTRFAHVPPSLIVLRLEADDASGRHGQHASYRSNR